MTKRTQGRLGLIIMTIFWGSSFAMNEIAMRAYTPYQLLALRFLMAAAILAAVFHRRLLRSKKALWIKGAVMGSILFSAYAFQTVGLAHTTPTKNAFLTAVYVILVPFMSLILWKRKIRRIEYAGAFLSLLGVGLMSLNGFESIALGDGLTLISAIFFAMQIIFTDSYAKQEDPLLLNTVQMMTAGVLSLIFVAFEGAPLDLSQATPNLAILYLTVFCTLLAFALQTWAQQFTSETETVLILTMESIFGMIFAILLVSDIPSLRTLIGAALIIGGVILVELNPVKLEPSITPAPDSVRDGSITAPNSET